jgi:hypothetical protein
MINDKMAEAKGGRRITKIGFSSEHLIPREVSFFSVFKVVLYSDQYHHFDGWTICGSIST